MYTGPASTSALIPARTVYTGPASTGALISARTVYTGPASTGALIPARRVASFDVSRLRYRNDVITRNGSDVITSLP